MRELVLVTGALSLTSCAHRVAHRRTPRVGFISGNEPVLVAAFEDELRKLGYVSGRNLHLEMRLARRNTTDTSAHAAELTSLGLDFIVAASLPQALAVRAADPTMPMVIITCPGMVENGFAHTLERPGGIYTGMDELPPGTTAKRLALLKTAAPAVKRVALLSTTPGPGGHELQLKEAQTAGPAIGVAVKSYRATSPAELRMAFGSIADEGMDGLLNFQGGFSLANRELIVEFAAAHRLPAIYQSDLFVDVGGLMAWAPDQREQYRMGARYADRIIRGERPGSLPIQHPHPYYLTVNTGAAARIGLSLAPAFIAQAHSVRSQ
jgi:putative ABC transport system substrate-binding protein